MFERNILTYLAHWRLKKGRKPLILRGARQVGKTSAVILFAEQYFEDFLSINLEKAEHFELFKETKTIAEFEKIVDLVFQKKLSAGKTLVFIDEIQSAPNLIALLRFFYEERPALHIIAAGSLLEAKIAKEGLSLPVGRVEYAWVYPLTFFEFLGAVGEKRLLKYLQEVDLKTTILPTIHNRALKLFYEYALVGGMPEAVFLYSKKNSQAEINSYYASLLTAYSEDVYKYASTAQTKYLRHVLEQAPYYSGQHITYEKFGGGDWRSREMSEAFEILEKTMLVRQVMATRSTSLPLSWQNKASKKLLYLDVGLVNFKNNLQAQYLTVADLNDVYRGNIAEQIVGQNIIANEIHCEQQLFYWTKEKPASSAEVDFCVAHKGRLIGIEVKSGHAGKMKSLAVFSRDVEKASLFRLYSGEMRSDVFTKGSKRKLVSLPFYLVNRLFDFC